MPDDIFLTLFLVGLLGGAHCAGMCGGIVAALALQVPAGCSQLSIHLAYNAGRLASYALAGLIAGALGLLLADLFAVQRALRILASLMLVGFGLTLLGVAALAPVERAGQWLWRRVQPCSKRFLPVTGPARALSLGLIWGWLPCGLVYSALVTAMASGSARQGALALLAFGLGTLPNLLLAGWLLSRFNRFSQSPGVRFVAGLLVAGFGLSGLVQLARN